MKPAKATSVATSAADLTAEHFEELQDAAFKVSAGDRDIEMTLTECVRLPQFKRPDSRTPFTLTFRSDETETLSQGSYSFQLPQLGITDLFLVPSGANTYQVSFN